PQEAAASGLIEMVRRSAQMLGSLPFCCVILDARRQRLCQISAWTIAQLGLGTGDVGEAVADVANPRRRMDGFGVGPEDHVNPIDELEQGGSSAAGDVIDLAGSALGVCGQ